MALIEKLNKDPQQKRRKHDSEDLDQYSTSGEDDSFEPDNKRPEAFVMTTAIANKRSSKATNRLIVRNKKKTLHL